MRHPEARAVQPDMRGNMELLLGFKEEVQEDYFDLFLQFFIIKYKVNIFHLHYIGTYSFGAWKTRNGAVFIYL